ncbi:MAG: Crp/Fnr family transcriptional regulator, partial [Yaniella sp.]|nr:Crp/Fnr family transcriptional regulator [Yaniella sp.]
QDDLTKLIELYPNIAHRMLRTLGDRLAHTEHRLTLSSQSVDVRIADYLLQQPLIRRGPVTNGIMRVQLPLSKKDIASLLGTTPESLSRALSRLRNKGFLTVDDDIVSLLQPDELEHLITGD